MGCGQLNESMLAAILRPQQSAQRPTRDVTFARYAFKEVGWDEA
jgi:hypothetical protein